VRAMGAHCGRERRKATLEATPKLVLKFYDSCYGGKQSYRSLFFFIRVIEVLYASSLFPFREKHTTILTACNTSEANILHLKLTRR